MESRSSETVSRATFCGRRRASGVTSAPIRTRSVATAIADRAIHGSTTGGPPGRAMWSQTKKPSQPARSAAAASSASARASPNAPKFGRYSPYFKAALRAE